MKYIDNRINATIVKLEDENNNYMSEDVEGALEEIDSKIKNIEANAYDDTKIKQDINNIKNEIGSTALNTDAINIKSAINEVNTRINTVEANAYDDTQIRQDINNIKTEIGTATLNTDAINIKSAINEVNSKIEINKTNVEGALEETNSRLENVITYDVTQLKDFDKNNINVAINNIKNQIKDGDTLLLPNGEYIATDTIDLDFGYKSRIKIKLIGKITFESTLDKPCVTLGGQYLDVCIEHLVFNNPEFNTSASNYEVLKGDGVNINMLYHSDVKIGLIEYFKNGININPGNDQGVQYNHINFKYLKYNTIGLNFEVRTDLAWATESVYSGGRIRGKTGVKTNKRENQFDTYNNNRFMYIGMEQILENGFELNWCANTSIYHPRFESVGGFFIIEGSDCAYNFFYTPYRGLVGNFKLQGKNSLLNGTIGIQGGGSKNIIYNTIDKNQNSMYFDSSFTPVPKDNATKVLSVKNQTGVKVEHGIKIIDVQTDTNEASIYVDKSIYETDGYIFFINISKYTNSLSILQPDNNSIAVNSYSFDGEGLYMVINAGGLWLLVSKIGDKLKN